MKNKAIIIGVAVLALGLGAVLFYVSSQARKEQQEARAQIGSLSNEMVSVRANLQEEQQVNLALSSNLSTTTTTYSNKLTETQESLRATEGNLEKAQSDAKSAEAAAQQEIAQRDKKITDLESRNAELDRQAEELHGAITNLEGQITVTKGKLAAAQGDRKFLLAELQRLVADKADLEKKFNDVTSLKQQMRKLKDELATERRLDWIRRGVYDLARQKGGERMMRHETPEPPGGPVPGLQVVLHSDGAAKATDTNAPPSAPANPQ